MIEQDREFLNILELSALSGQMIGHAESVVSSESFRPNALSCGGPHYRRSATLNSLSKMAQIKHFGPSGQKFRSLSSEGAPLNPEVLAVMYHSSLKMEDRLRLQKALESHVVDIRDMSTRQQQDGYERSCHLEVCRLTHSSAE